MAQHKSKKSVKPTIKKRTLNPPGGGKKGSSGASFQHLDPKRRLGNFETTGEHAHIGGRFKGVVGQRINRWRTEQKKRGK